MRNKFISAVAIVIALACNVASAQAQSDFPNKPVRIISPFAAGGPTDTLLRVISDKLIQKWNQPVIIETKPGAGTMVAAGYMARANPDGYTISFVIGALALNPAVRTNVPYDLEKDFTYVTQLANTLGLPLVANVDFPPNTIAEVVEFAKKANPALRYTSPGPGGEGHLLGALLAKQTGIKLQHVPYNGSAPALVDVLANRVPLMFDVWISVRPHIEAKKLKVIALPNTKRMPGFDFPTITETIPDFVGMDSPSGIIAPAGIPKDITEKLARDISEVANSPEVAERLRSFEFEPVRGTPAEFEKKMKDLYVTWKKIATDANIHIE